MEYRTAGKSDLKLSVISFGAWAIGGWMWGGNDDKEAIQAIEAGIEKGITSIDTAAVYGFGHSEKLVGKAIKGKRDKIQLLTKFGLQWKGTKGTYHFTSQDDSGKPVDIYKYGGKDRVIEECEESLKRLGTDYIDLYQMHWPDPSTPISETLEALEQLIAQGKIKAAGVSNFSLEQLEEAIKHLPIAVNQVPYSMVNRGIEGDVVPFCIINNVGILAYSPMQRGLLTGKITPDYKFKPGDHRPSTPFFRKDNIESVNRFLNRIKPIANQHQATLAQIVINWTLNQPGVTSVLAGARNAQQVTDNAGADNFRLSNEEITLINNYLDELKLDLS